MSASGSAAPIRTAVGVFAELAQLVDRFEADEVRPARAAQVRFDAQVGAAGDDDVAPGWLASIAKHSASVVGREKRVQRARDRAAARAAPRRSQKRAGRRRPERERRVANRTIARAPAEIARHRQRIARTDAVPAVVLGEQAHDEAGRAVAALRSAGRGHGLLRLGQLAVVGERLHGVDLVVRRPTAARAGSCSPRDTRCRPRRGDTRATAHAPHSPSAQPSFAPVRPLRAHEIQQRRVRGGRVHAHGASVQDEIDVRNAVQAFRQTCGEAITACWRSI